MKTANPSRKQYIIAGIITLAIFSMLPLSIVFDNYRENKLKTSGGYVAVANLSDHRVAIRAYGHDSVSVVEHDYRLEAGEEYIIQSGMSEEEVLAFPPEGFVDSAMLLFDDSIAMRHGPQDCFGLPSYTDNNIQENIHWRYEPVQAGRASGKGGTGRPFYRAIRRYTLTNEDYDRAVSRSATASAPAPR